MFRFVYKENPSHHCPSLIYPLKSITEIKTLLFKSDLVLLDVSVRFALKIDCGRGVFSPLPLLFVTTRLPTRYRPQSSSPCPQYSVTHAALSSLSRCVFSV